MYIFMYYFLINIRSNGIKLLLNNRFDICSVFVLGIVVLITLLSNNYIANIIPLSKTSSIIMPVKISMICMYKVKSAQ